MLDDDGKPVPQDGTTIGEVCARSNVVLKGYWLQPEETAKAIYDGYFHTGDLAVWDEFGNIHIVDRKKDVIISGGENISSPEIEDALYKHPAVLECAVVGVPSEKWGETPKALVVLRDGAEADRGRDHRLHARAPGALQVPDFGRVRRVAAAHGDGQAAEVRDPRAVLGGRRAKGELMIERGHASAMHELADRFFASIEAGDIEAIRSIYATDAVIWHNFDGKEQTVEENLATMGWIARSFSGFGYEQRVRDATETGFVERHLTRGRTAKGEEFSFPACIVCTVVDGRITRLDEYLDSAQISVLLA